MVGAGRLSFEQIFSRIALKIKHTNVGKIHIKLFFFSKILLARQKLIHYKSTFFFFFFGHFHEMRIVFHFSRKRFQKSVLLSNNLKEFHPRRHLICFLSDFFLPFIPSLRTCIFLWNHFRVFLPVKVRLHPLLLACYLLGRFLEWQNSKLDMGAFLVEVLKSWQMFSSLISRAKYNPNGKCNTRLFFLISQLHQKEILNNSLISEYCRSVLSVFNILWKGK